jgi:tRNA(Phe) wybutosine-synthesizing methylase Tyw3
MNAFTETPAILAAAVDRLALIKAEIARLTAEEKALKESLTASGLEAIDGTAHRVAISHCAGRVSIDWETIAAKFNPSRQLVAAHTSTGAPYTVVRVSARKGA